MPEDGTRAAASHGVGDREGAISPDWPGTAYAEKAVVPQSRERDRTEHPRRVAGAVRMPQREQPGSQFSVQYVPCPLEAGQEGLNGGGVELSQ